MEFFTVTQHSSEEDQISFLSVTSPQDRVKKQATVTVDRSGEENRFRCNCMKAVTTSVPCVHIKTVKEFLFQEPGLSTYYNRVVYRRDDDSVYPLPPLALASRLEDYMKGEHTVGGYYAHISYQLSYAYTAQKPLEEVEIKEEDFVDLYYDKEKAEKEKNQIEHLKKERQKKLKTVPWRNLKKPDWFAITEENWEALLYVLATGRNGLLLGRTGQGKSSVVAVGAEMLGLNMESFNLGSMCEARTSLIGATFFSKEKGTYFNESRFVRAIKNENVILADELTRAPVDAFNILFPLLDEQRYLSLDEADNKDQLVFRHDKASILATANVGMEYTGTMALDRALLDRFPVKIEIQVPPKDAEIRVLKKRFPTMGSKNIEKLVKLANDQRDMEKNGEFDAHISTRMLIDYFDMIDNDVSQKAAFQTSILGCFNGGTMEGESSEREKIKNLIQKHKVI